MRRIWGYFTSPPEYEWNGEQLRYLPVTHVRRARRARR